MERAMGALGREGLGCLLTTRCVLVAFSTLFRRPSNLLRVAGSDLPGRPFAVQFYVRPSAPRVFDFVADGRVCLPYPCVRLATQNASSSQLQWMVAVAYPKALLDEIRVGA